MKVSLAIGLSLLIAAAAVQPLRAQPADAKRTAAEVCASCHGPGGHSTTAAFPRLAGQTKEYLTAQLKAFRDRSRGDPMAQAFMWGMAAQLNDDAIAALAAYYAEQKPSPGRAGDAKLIREGQAIFEGGIPASQVVPCATCHQSDARGKEAFPMLAGQHADYLVKQLALFKSELRTGANAAIMHGVSAGMTFDQMQAVAAYLASR
jgi:cytochrome c553